MDAPESLAGFIEAAGSGGHLRVEADLGDGFYRLRVDEAERRQAVQDIRSSEDIVIEMLRNARDAHARNVFVATSREGSVRTITMIDDGDGVPPAMHQLIFEPRVTSKLDTMSFDQWGVHGRGMALFSIASNALEARVAASDRGFGAAITVRTDTDSLGEKTDQSSFPTFLLTGEGTVAIRGPKNIVRTACEFALEQRRSMSVFLGTPSEIASALYAYGTATLPARMRAFACENDVSVCKRLALAADDVSLAECAERIGLDLSARTARRILDGQIVPARTLLERIEEAGIHRMAPESSSSRTRGSGSRAPRRDSRVRIAKDDLDAFAARVHAAYTELAEAYYLDPAVEPVASVSNDTLRVSLPLFRLD